MTDKVNNKKKTTTEKSLLATKFIGKNSFYSLNYYPAIKAVLTITKRYLLTAECIYKSTVYYLDICRYFAGSGGV